MHWEGRVFHQADGLCASVTRNASFAMSKGNTEFVFVQLCRHYLVFII